jgi:formamidopyrimidine-DNA glycosylase
MAQEEVMPELPEVETLRQYLEQTVLGRTIAGIYGFTPTVDPGNLPPLTGHAITGTFRHGKFLFADLDSGSSLVFHFGMTGDLILVPGEDPDPLYTRAVVSFPDGTRLAFTDPRRFGRLRWIPDRKAFIAERRLGPDALTMSRETFLAITAGSHQRVKLFLLDQHRIAGIGNIYADEILFQAGIRPLRSLHDLDPPRLSLLAAGIVHVLRTAVDRNADFDYYPSDWLIPHRSPGERCPCCGETVNRVMVAGRYAYFCPSCQK